jgi:hypothetical protein
MATYTQLTNDEKTAIKQGAVRSLEYQMYALEIDLLAENAKETPDTDRVTNLQNLISEKEAQIASVLED